MQHDQTLDLSSLQPTTEELEKRAIFNKATVGTP